MALLLTKRISTYSDGSFIEEVMEEEIPPVQLYQYREDVEALGELRGCAYTGCPAVMVLRGDPDTILTEQWQYFIYAINKGMSINAIASLLGNQKAITNAPEGQHEKNYISGENMDGELPRLPKLLTFSRNVHACTEVNGMLKVKTFDGNLPPPLKVGRSYPRSLAEVNPDDYLIMPKYHREMFLVCNNVKATSGGSIVFPFAHGITRDWIGDNNIYTFFPLVSWYKDILTPPSKWIKLPTNSPFPSPYRR